MTNIQLHIDRIQEANRITNRKTIYAAGAGLIPFPIVDTAALLGVQLTMIQSIANLYDIEFKQHIAKSLIGSLLGSIGSVGLIKIIPGLGTVVGGATASVAGATATYALGRVFTQHFDQGGTLLDFDPISSREYFQKEYEEGQLFISEQDLIEEDITAHQNGVSDTNMEGGYIARMQLIKENKTLQAELDSLQKDVELLEDELDPEAAKKRAAKKEAAIKSNQLNGHSEKAQLIDENNELQTVLSKLQKEIELLEDQLDPEAAKKRAAKKRITTKSSQINGHSEKKQFQLEMEQLQATLLDLQQEIILLESEQVSKGGEKMVVAAASIIASKSAIEVNKASQAIDTSIPTSKTSKSIATSASSSAKKAKASKVANSLTPTSKKSKPAATSSPTSKSTKETLKTTSTTEKMDIRSSSAVRKIADFTIIEGIGPKLDKVLKDAGIYSMKNLSQTPVSKLKEIVHAAGKKFNFSDPASWPLQASLAADGQMKELKKLQEELIGGRAKRK